jgi:hypothetical protein
VKKTSKEIVIAVASAAALTFTFTFNRWKSSQATPSTDTKNPSMQMDGSKNEPVDRVAFLNAVFNNTKPPIDISRILLSPGGLMPVDSTKKALKWSEETQNHALVALINYDLFALFREGN